MLGPSDHYCSGIIIADDARFRSIHTPAPEPGDLGWLDDILAVFARVFDDIVLVTGNPATYMMAYDGLIVSDHHAPCSLWSGIQAGLFTARHAHAFVTVGGQPVSEKMVRLFLDAVAPRYDAVLTAGVNGPLSVPGVYAKNCLKPLGRQLSQGERQKDRWLHQIRVHTLAQETLRTCDPLWQPFQ
ncbi:MAG: hypothetical protein VR64_17670 [Desulfatitalea sp. BRH_c12]|nr:MAG: hypothetical protein VR64_17670 [Desulfatitalea sp. BRH_c12]